MIEGFDRATFSAWSFGVSSVATHPDVHRIGETKTDLCMTKDRT
jgi:hypothetical protein